MRRHTIITAIALAAPALLLGCAPQHVDEEGPAALKPTSSLVDVGGFRLHLRCQGEGSPVVVLDTGIGETYRTWGSVMEEVSRETRVCGYDRAGYGESEAGPMPRSARQVNTELATLLEQAAAGVSGRPPYVLVGHSLGALHSLVFAADHPDLVAGLVIIDPPPIGFLSGERFPELGQLFQRQIEDVSRAAREARESGEEAQALFYETLASEQEMLATESLEQLLQISDLGSLPLVVISSETPNFLFGEEAEAFQAYWIESNEEVAALSTDSKFVLAEGSGHHVHLDAPGLLIGLIREMVSTLRREGSPE